MKDPTITVIGSINADLTTRTPRFPRPGETLNASSFSTGCGGKGANQAVACARLSNPRNPSNANMKDSSDIKVQMFGAVGDDAYGRNFLDLLQQSFIDTSSIKIHPGINTGTAIITVEEQSGENHILITPGANGTLTPDLFRNVPSNLPNLIILQLEIPRRTVLQIIVSARKAHVPVLLNPSPVYPLGDEYLQDLQHLVLNENEAVSLTGIALDEGHRSHDLEEALQLSSDHLRSRGVQNIIITLGAKGAWYSFAQGQGALLAAGKVSRVVDTTAAGDTFVGAYAVAIVKGVSVEEAVRLANVAAAKTVEREGAMDAIPWADEVQELMC